MPLQKAGCYGRRPDVTAESRMLKRDAGRLAIAGRRASTDLHSTKQRGSAGIVAKHEAKRERRWICSTAQSGVGDGREV